MAGFTVERLSNEPIVIVREQPSYKPMEEIGLLIEAVIAEADQFGRPGYGIILSKGDYDFEEVLVAAKDMRVQGARLRQHPHYLGTIIVVPDEGIKKLYSSMSSEAMGGLIYRVFDTLEGALAHARAHL